MVKDDEATGKRVVAGTHWDFDSYGGTIKKQLGMPTQASHPDSAISNFMSAWFRIFLSLWAMAFGHSTRLLPLEARHHW